MDKILLSKRRIAELKKDLHALKTSLLQKKEADAEHGGLLDSWHETASHAATQGAIEAQVQKMKNILQRAEVLPRKIISNKVVLGSWVKLIDGNKKEFNYRLVHPIESNPIKGLISTDSPIGMALMDKKAGETVQISGKRSKIKMIS